MVTFINSTAAENLLEDFVLKTHVLLCTPGFLRAKSPSRFSRCIELLKVT